MDLLERAMAGDTDARRQFVESQMDKLSATLGTLYKPDKDLRQELLHIMVVEALANFDRYNPEKGAFATWARWISRNAINAYLDEQPTVSLDAVREDGLTLHEVVGSVDYGYEAAEARIDVEEALSFLDDRERKVVERRFGIGSDPQTFGAIGHDLGITKQAAHQIYERAMKRLRDG